VPTLTAPTDGQLRTSEAIDGNEVVFLTEQELATRWKVQPRTLRRMERDGQLRVVRVRGSKRYSMTEIHRIEIGTSMSPVSVAMPEVEFHSPAWQPRLRGLRSGYSLCVAHRKGGVCKTTSTFYFALEFARAGKRIICRDLDNQRSLTHVFRDLGATFEGGVAVLTGSIALVPDGAQPPFRPDVELIDTPPSLDDSLPGVERADGLVIPALPEHQSLRALEDMFEALDANRDRYPYLEILGVLPSKVNARWAEHRDALRTIRQIASAHAVPVLSEVPLSRFVLSYSNRGHPWRPAAAQLLEQLAESTRA
jgi:chromosome partitioning protein